MNKFIKVRVLVFDDEEEQERNAVGFSDAKTKKKKKKKKASGQIAEVIVPIDSIISVAKVDDVVLLDILDRSYTIVDDFEDIKKKLKVK